MSQRDEQVQLIADCEARESKLSDWERGFISSLRERVDAGGSLTMSQADILSRIWEQVT